MSGNPLFHQCAECQFAVFEGGKICMVCGFAYGGHQLQCEVPEVVGPTPDGPGFIPLATAPSSNPPTGLPVAPTDRASSPAPEPGEP